MKTIRLVQLDGKLPNLALMKLAHWHRQQGDGVTFTRRVQPSLFEPAAYDIVYGSAIFDQSMPTVQELIRSYPQAIVGGSGTGEQNLAKTVEQVLGIGEYENYDYSIYPDYPWSIGFTQRGCRLKCPFCLVPRKEGNPIGVNSIEQIWRPGSARNIILLDNDFFGQPRHLWKERIRELEEGGFKVSFNQGVNVRLVNDEAAEALASLRYYDHKFTRRRLYTAWDNIGQEKVFFRGLERLERAGIPARHLMVYMLTGFDPGETMADVQKRYQKLRDAGCMPFPMVYQQDLSALDPNDPGEKEEIRKAQERFQERKRFQRWVIRRYDQVVPWENFGKNEEPERAQWDLQEGEDGYDPAELDGYNQELQQEPRQEPQTGQGIMGGLGISGRKRRDPQSPPNAQREETC